jgi:RimJ/RimL family protein N-acetyltransferase
MIDDPSSQRPKEYILKALRTREGKMIGSCSLSSYTNGNSNRGLDTGVEKGAWEITYDLDPEYWGRGMGKWIVGFLVNWAGWAGISSINAVSPSRS